MQVPEVAGFNLNASIGSMTNGNTGDFQARMTFPLFVGGERQLQRKWVGNGSLPNGMGDQYTDDQLELLCVSEVSLHTAPKHVYVLKTRFVPENNCATCLRAFLAS